MKTSPELETLIEELKPFLASLYYSDNGSDVQGLNWADFKKKLERLNAESGDTILNLRSREDLLPILMKPIDQVMDINSQSTTHAKGLISRAINSFDYVFQLIMDYRAFEGVGPGIKSAWNSQLLKYGLHLDMNMAPFKRAVDEMKREVTIDMNEHPDGFWCTSNHLTTYDDCVYFFIKGVHQAQATFYRRRWRTELLGVADTSMKFCNAKDSVCTVLADDIALNPEKYRGMVARVWGYIRLEQAKVLLDRLGLDDAAFRGPRGEGFSSDEDLGFEPLPLPKEPRPHFNF
jgi:hypothetical protein